MNKKIIIAAVGGVVGGLAGGFALGYFSTRAKFRNEAEAEIGAMRQWAFSVRKEDYPDPEAAVKALHPEGTLGTPIFDNLSEEYGAGFLKQQTEDALGKEEVTEEEVSDFANEIKGFESIGALKTPYQTMFEGEPINPDDHDEEPQNVEIDTNKPYIISIDEWARGDLEFPQPTLTYYEGDDKLTDEHNRPIDADDVDSIVGIENLTKFGTLSKDENVLYIRNIPRRIDAEIVRDPGTYQEVVLGIKPNKSTVQKMREDAQD